MIIYNKNMPSKVLHSFDILGSCVCRNIFNIKDGREDLYEVHSFVQRSNPLLFNQQGLDDFFTDSDVDLLLDYLKSIDAKGMLDVLSHNFNIRMLKSLINGSTLDLIKKNIADWIIIDTFYMYADDTLIIRKGNKEWLLKTDKTFSYLVKMILETNPKYSEYSVESLASSLNIDFYVGGLCDYLTETYGSQVILINSRPAAYLELNDSIDKTNYEITGSTESMYFVLSMLKKINCFYIDVPSSILSKDEVPVHYTEDCMEYLRKCVNEIVDGTYKNPSADFLILDLKILIKSLERKARFTYNCNKMMDAALKTGLDPSICGFKKLICNASQSELKDIAMNLPKDSKNIMLSISILRLLRNRTRKDNFYLISLLNNFDND